MQASNAEIVRFSLLAADQLVTTKSMLSRIGKTVRDLRERLGWSQSELAVKAGVSLSTVNKIERDELVPSRVSMAKIATALGVSLDHLDPNSASVLLVVPASIAAQVETYSQKLQGLVMPASELTREAASADKDAMLKNRRKPKG
jgi:transcriptional regulator with XRE-family HTH domain